MITNLYLFLYQQEKHFSLADKEGKQMARPFVQLCKLESFQSFEKD